MADALDVNGCPAPVEFTPSLNGRVALVTGGARGIGRAIATRLAGYGAQVAITYASSKIDADQWVFRQGERGRRAIAIETDLGDPVQAQRAVDATVEAFGRLDILVNNAGILISGEIAEVDAASVDRALAVNVRGTFAITQAALARMGRGGRIINIGSVSSEYMPFSGQSVYAMTKSAIVGLTRGLAREVGPGGITVNNVQPGRILTDLLRQAVPSGVEKLAELTAVRRLGDPKDVAGIVAFLASQEASFITGCNLRVDGGTSV